MSDEPESIRDKNTAALLEQVEKRIAFEIDSRKSSETRALAIITLNVGITTVYFALRAQLGLWTGSIPDCIKILLIASTAILFASIVVAVVAVIPANVKVLDANAFRELRNSVNRDGPQDLLTDELLEARVAELERLSKVARAKASLTLAAVIIFAIAVVVFVLAATLSSL